MQQVQSQESANTIQDSANANPEISKCKSRNQQMQIRKSADADFKNQQMQISKISRCKSINQQLLIRPKLYFVRFL